MHKTHSAEYMAQWQNGCRLQRFLMRGRVKEKVILKLQDKAISSEDFQSLIKEELQFVFARGVSVEQFRDGKEMMLLLLLPFLQSRLKLLL